MQDIKIGRYDVESTYHLNENGEKESIGWGGWVEDEDRSWILFLSEEGRPSLLWLDRDEDGGVIGDPIRLDGPRVKTINIRF